MRIIKAYKFRLYPNDKQKQFFEQNFGNVRFIYNKMLSDKIEHYKKTKEMLYNTPAQYKKEFEFLKLSDSLSLSNAQLDLEKAYKNFFRNPSFGFPKFKKKHKNKNSYKTNNQNGSIYIDDKYIKLPKIGFVEIRMERQLPKDAVIKNVTISKTKTNKYFASIQFEYEKEVEQVQPESYLGLDFAMSDFYVDSEGVKGNYPKFFRKSQEKLAKEQRKLSRMVKGSNNYNKQKIKIARIHEKIANQRKDFLHKTSRKIANSHDVICVESLNMKAMSQTFKLGKSVHDAGWGMFVQMLKYKLEESGKYLIVANKFFPSTKQCSSCNHKKDEIHLSERTYECESCGLEIDRDLNAALNLRQYAIENLQVSKVLSDFTI